MNQEKEGQLSVIETQRLTELLETEQLAAETFRLLCLVFSAENVGATSHEALEILRGGTAVLLTLYGDVSALWGPAPEAEVRRMAGVH